MLPEAGLLCLIRECQRSWSLEDWWSWHLRAPADQLPCDGVIGADLGGGGRRFVADGCWLENVFLQGAQVLVECRRTAAPWFLGVVFLQWIQLLLHLLPALQAAPQPIGAHHSQVLTPLGLADLLCACWEEKILKLIQISSLLSNPEQ